MSRRKAVVTATDEGMPKASARQLAEYERVKERANSRPPKLPIKITKNASGQIEMDSMIEEREIHMARFKDVCGTNDANWAAEVGSWLSATGEKAMGNERSVQAGLAFMAGIQPQNELEAALAVQMFTTHAMAMRMAVRAEMQKDLEAIGLMYGQYNKLTRTFAAQVEALAKLRNGGKQTVEVKYVDARNSQNIIADTVSTSGGGQIENRTQPHEPAQPLSVASLAAVACTPVRSTEPAGESMPVSRDEGAA